MVCSKNFFRILTKNVKTICSKESTWEQGGAVECKFDVLTTFTIHFSLCLIFIRVWPIEDLFFEIIQTWNKLPGYHQNGFVATQALGHMMYVMYRELLYCIYIKPCWQSSVTCIYAGVILETEGSIQQSSNVNNCCSIAI